MNWMSTKCLSCLIWENFSRTRDNESEPGETLGDLNGNGWLTSCAPAARRRGLNLCRSRRADLKPPTSRISNEILLALFHTHCTPSSCGSSTFKKKHFPVSWAAAEPSNLRLSFKYSYVAIRSDNTAGWFGWAWATSSTRTRRCAIYIT